MGVQYGTRTEMCSFLTKPESVADPIEALATYAAQKGVSVSQYDAKSLRNTTPPANDNIRQWTYQYCTEFGWFQVPSKIPTRSSILSGEANWLDYCKRIFGDEIKAPHVASTNAYYGGLEIPGKNIVFVTASEDPWQYAGLRHSHNPELPSVRVECEDCGHCIDLHAYKEGEPKGLTEARE